MRKVLERDVEDYFCSECAKKEWEVRKVQFINRNGCPDRVVFAGWGVVIFVELKKPRGKFNGRQPQEIASMRQRGMKVEVLSTCEMVDDFVKRYS